MKTLKNKLVAVALVGLGSIPAVLYNDGTVLVFMIMFAIPLFVAKENLIK